MTTIEQFTGLTDEEKALLIKAPVLISILAAGGDDNMSEYERAEAVSQAHLKTFTGTQLLHPYYTEVDHRFKANFDLALALYTPFNDHRRARLTQEVDRLNKVIGKLDSGYANTLRKSLGDYARHVKYADRKFIGNYLFPFSST